MAIAENNLGRSLYQDALARADMQQMQEALHAFAAASDRFSIANSPDGRVAWATAQFNYADALIEIGRHEDTTYNLERAIALNEGVLNVRRTFSVPLEVALTYVRLSEAMELVGHRNRDRAVLLQARAAAESAQQIYTTENRASLAAECAGRLARLDRAIARTPQRESSDLSWAH
jgi:tetratricopeptide (TPR) repeat protein